MRRGKRVGDVAETGVLRLLERRLAGQGRNRRLVRGIGDDVATVRTGSRDVVLTVDAMVEDVHFRRRWTPARLLGWKALAVNVSDVAAAGGIPVAAVVSLELPAGLPTAWLKSLYDGLLEAGKRFGVAVAGGNLSRGRKAAIHVALAGEAPRKLVGRKGARAGDVVAVTGTLGGSLAGLLCLKKGIRAGAAGRAIRRHLRPEPSVNAGRALGAVASAQMDVSDGLAADAARLARASGVRVEIEPARVPLNPAAGGLAAALRWDPVRLALESGEEYELLAAIPPARFGLAQRLVEKAGRTLTAIGGIRRGRGVKVAGAKVRYRGFDHFRR